MKNFFILSVLLGTISAASAQDINGIWHKLPDGTTAELGSPALRSEHFTAFSVTEKALENYLATAPTNPDQGIRIALPAPDGGYRNFKLWSTPVMEPALAAKYPGIRTYTATLEGDPRVTAKLDYTQHGFHAMVYDGGNTYIVNPYGLGATGFYAATYKRDVTRPNDAYMSCGVGDEAIGTPEGDGTAQRVNGTTRKVYRLALSCTGEYAIAVDGPTPTTAGVLARMVTTMNRVNGVYERELAVSMTIIANNSLLIYLDPTTDPYSNNNNGGTMLGENQSNTTTVIGNANYDIGHVFSTGGGGVAGLGVVCANGGKARGVTGSPSPMGDPYDIDYVAHEMGHQFGANHTFNATSGSCTGNGVPGTAFEPGSGSTIMAYAGLCLSNNLQNNSHDYFHSASLEQISSYITVGGGAACPSLSISPNTNAVLAPFSATYAIPSGTAFELTAPQAVDATADTAVNYCWEERDLGNFGGTLVSTTNLGPLFRSFPPDISRTRTFPILSRLLVGQFNHSGERIPTVSRILSFGVTQRDMFQGWGTFNFPDDRITLNVEAMAPFTVTSPEGGEVWTGGDLQTITWNVSNTNAAPINCANVDIFMSIDNGQTFPYTLAANTPNDGSEQVRIPNPQASNFVRIKVKGSNNVFFAISARENFLDKGTVSVGNAPATENVSLSPVPAKNSLRVTVPASLGKVNLRLMNMLGQTVWTGSASGDQALDASIWPRGVYHMAMQNEKGFQQTKKLVLE